MVIFFTATGSFPDNSLVFQISPFPDDVRSSVIPACPSVGVKETADADGRLETVLTDEGEIFRVVEDASGMRVGADAAIRIVANYETLTTDDKVAGVKLYALLQAISPVPLAADEFEEGVKTEPSEVQSIWLGHDYLNIILKVKQQGKHLFHFVEDEVSVDEASGRAKVRLTLFHDVTSATQDYSKRAYLSVPLRQYMIDGVQGVDVFFSVCTYSGRLKTYILDETGLHVEE